MIVEEIRIILDPRECERKRATIIKKIIDSLPNEIEGVLIIVFPISDSKYVKTALKLREIK